MALFSRWGVKSYFMYFYKRFKLVNSLYKKLHKKNNFKVQKKLSYIVLNILAHCNLNCKGCDHFSPIAQDYCVSLDSIQNDLTQLSKITDTKVNRIGVMGGEPLLHPDLLEILASARQFFPHTKIELLTNGILLLSQQEIFWNVCKENDIILNVTKYPINVDYEKIFQTAKEKKVQICYYGTSGVSEKTSHKFKLDPDGKQDPADSFRHCLSANTCPLVMEGKLYPCTIMPCSTHLNKNFLTDLQISKNDYIDLYGTTDYKEILSFLSKPTPFCRYCKTTELTKGHKWEVSSKSLDEWT